MGFYRNQRLPDRARSNDRSIFTPHKFRERKADTVDDAQSTGATHAMRDIYTERRASAIYVTPKQEPVKPSPDP